MVLRRLQRSSSSLGAVAWKTRCKCDAVAVGDKQIGRRRMAFGTYLEKNRSRRDLVERRDSVDDGGTMTWSY